jgi:uncharacterized membrane protein
MTSLLIAVLEAAFVMLVVLVILFIAYGLSLRVVKTVTKSSEEKRRPFACGELLQPSETGVPDASMYWAIWKKLFRSFYNTLRDKIHTGILNDWLFWMFIFMVVLVIIFVVVMIK